MKQTRSLERLLAAVTVMLLLTCSASSGGQTRLDHGPVGSQAADHEAARTRGHLAQPAACRPIPHHTK